MKIALLTIMLCFHFMMKSTAQNLVPNPSFEDTVFMAQCYGPIEGAKYWFNPHGASPDYFTYFPTNCGPVSSLNNPLGYQLAKSGISYAGIYGIVSPTREYIAVRLNDSLLSGQCYYAEMFCSLANLSRFSTDRLGMHFTNDTSGMSLSTTNIPLIPQIENNFGSFLSDTMIWMKVSGTFTAIGSETFLIIGNFYDDANTPLDTVFVQSNWNAAFYYLDDIFVTPCDSISGLKSHDNNFNIYPNPTSNYFTIENRLNAIEIDQIRVFNYLGQEITNKINIPKKFESNIKIDVRFIPNGYYFLKIITENGAIFYKIIKI